MTQNKSKKLVSRCPVCGDALDISRLSCRGCETRIETQIPVPALLRLPDDLQEFVRIFVSCRGNIREVEKELGISYPTVCKRLDLVNELLGNRAGERPAPKTRMDVLEQLEKGEISAREAARLLKGR